MNDSISLTDGKKIGIKRPEQWKGRELAWGNTFFPGIRNSKTLQSVYYLLNGYDSTECRIVFDRNGNADFSDDTIRTIYPGQSFFEAFANSRDDKARFRYEFRYSNTDPAAVNDTIYKYLTAYSYAPLPKRFFMLEKRMNYRRVLLPDSNVVTLHDYDCNGFYNDDRDQVFAGDIVAARAPGSPEIQ